MKEKSQLLEVKARKLGRGSDSGVSMRPDCQVIQSDWCCEFQVTASDELRVMLVYYPIVENHRQSRIRRPCETDSYLFEV